MENDITTEEDVVSTTVSFTDLKLNNNHPQVENNQRSSERRSSLSPKKHIFIPGLLVSHNVTLGASSFNQIMEVANVCLTVVTSAGIKNS